ncbi:hypothetical protein [Nocardia tengchongensis]
MPDDRPQKPPTVNRRVAIGTGAAALGGVALGAGLTAAAAADGTPGALPGASDVYANLNKSPHPFHLTAADMSHYDGGTLQGAHEQNFPVLAGQNGAAYFVRLPIVVAKRH